ncbi:ketopantoate reductase family protein [Staphylococcus schleiferi]|uniref:ketopantoate reductase family protein n=1 Tax=Staphylococcus schleiferi TaxID=1295 RepID=UPI002481054B|nr:2-dehydropantoate 2-reductase [Staphylococcus schleiferi]
MYKIAIAGAGAMGGRIGTSLKKAGYDVTLIDDWAEHVQRINSRGMEIKTENETYTVEIPAVLSKDVSETYDLIIILTKAMQSEAMLTRLKEAGAIHEQTAILSMINGLGHDERLSKFVPMSQIYLAVTMWTAGLRGPGQLLLEGEGAIEFYRASGDSDEQTEIIFKALDEAGLHPHINDNVFEAIWSKATLNSVLNPLCTILDKTIYDFGSYDHSRNMIVPIIDEIVAVAKARGVELDKTALIQKIEGAYPKEKQGLHYPSMHQDYKNGRLTEIDYLNGQIAKYGEALQIPTPVNTMLTHQIHQLEMKHNQA